MEIRPPLGTPLTPLTRRTESRDPRSTSHSNEEIEAQKQERLSNERITAAQERAEEAEKSASYQMEQTKEEYDHRAMQEASREEIAYDDQRQKGYEALKNLKRNQQLEMARAKRDGERAIAGLEGYYSSTERKLESDGNEKLAELQRSHGMRLEYEKRNAMAETESTRVSNRQQLESSLHQQEEQLRSMKEANRAEYERMRENLELATHKSEEDFNQKYQSTVQKEHDIIGGISSRASQQIREIRQDTAARLSAYNERQRDPFYKLLTHDASLREGRNDFTLTAKVPEHEQKGITVSVHGNELVVSGYRRNEEKLELSPGHKQSSSSYQTFTESFPLSYPVDPKKLSKRFEGDRLIVNVPKLQGFQVTPQHQAKADPKKQEIERPDWPKNLPHINDSHTPAPDDDDHPKHGGPGSGTLT